MTRFGHNGEIVLIVFSFDNMACTKEPVSILVYNLHLIVFIRTNIERRMRHKKTACFIVVPSSPTFKHQQLTFSSLDRPHGVFGFHHCICFRMGLRELFADVGHNMTHHCINKKLRENDFGKRTVFVFETYGVFIKPKGTNIKRNTKQFVFRARCMVSDCFYAIFLQFEQLFHSDVKGKHTFSFLLVCFNQLPLYCRVQRETQM